MTKAILLCGGEGTRMRPLTFTTPKPLLKIGERTILEYVLDNLKKNDINEVIFTVGYLKEKIIEYFDKFSKHGLKIEYLKEYERKNTAGSILPLKDKIKEDFVVMMGDQITNINLKNMIRFHKENGGIATIALKKIKIPVEYGVVDIYKNKVSGFEEKPIIERYINTAIYVLSPKIFEYIKEKEDFAKDVFPRLIEKNEKINAYFMEEEWIDIGRLKDYKELNENLERIEFAIKK